MKQDGQQFGLPGNHHSIFYWYQQARLWWENEETLFLFFWDQDTSETNDGLE